MNARFFVPTTQMFKMKTLALVLSIVLLSVHNPLHAQQDPANHQKFYFFKTWALLKYNHPKMASGKVDADSIFLSYLKRIDQAKTKTQTEGVILDMLQSLGPLTAAGAPVSQPLETDLLKNIDHKWFTSKKFSSAALRLKLQQVYAARYTSGQHHYYMPRHFDVDLPNEKAYNFPDTAALPYAHRMLSLAKIQGAIDYLFPHKYLMEKDWDLVVQQAIPRFGDAQSRRDYEKELLLLTAALRDTHVNDFYKTLKYGKSILKVRFYPPFDYVLVNGGKQILVTKVIVPELCAAADIQPGDLISKINEVTVQERVTVLSRYLSASNANALHHQLNNYLDNLLFITDSLNADLTYKRAGKTLTTRIEWVSKQKDLGLLTDHVRQLNAAKMQGKDLEFIADDVVIFRANENTRFLNAFMEDHLDAGMDSLFSEAGKQKGMIFDMRQYPTWGGFPFFLYNKFGQDTMPFAQYYALNKQQFGAFRLMTDNIEYYPPTAKPGMHLYKGKVIILVNGNTRSAGEHNTMLLQHMFPQSITIGTQTAGADGDIVRLTLPAGHKLEFTGNAIFYPDGSEIQRKGVKIDKIINVKSKDLLNNKDTLIEAALQLMSAN